MKPSVPMANAVIGSIMTFACILYIVKVYVYRVYNYCIIDGTKFLINFFEISTNISNLKIENKYDFHITYIMSKYNL